MTFYTLRGEPIRQQKSPFKMTPCPTIFLLNLLLAFHRNLVPHSLHLNLVRSEILNIQVHFHLLPVNLQLVVRVDALNMIDRCGSCLDKFHWISEERVPHKHGERILESPGDWISSRQIPQMTKPIRRE
uniref:Small heat shock protein 15.0 n=1 Tax=Spodoptera litura TaxID=69820 RepID=I3QQD2_SPOLT|nr:small heat shock protein 15.0 [Spodoptera litura]